MNLRLFVLLSLLLPGYVAHAQLNCGNPINIDPGQYYGGTTIGKPSNVNTYCGLPTQGYTGSEALHRILWPGGNIEITLEISSNNGTYPDLNLFLLSDCNNANDCIEFATQGQDKVILTKNDLAQGTYYLVVDGWQGASGTYSLQTNVPSSGNLDCNNAINVTPGQLYTGSTSGKPDNVNDYCNWNNPFNTGPEVLHKIDWPGGDLEVTLGIQLASGSYPNLNIIMLDDCNNVNNCRDFQFGNGQDKATLTQPGLAAGTYYFVVDGWVGANGAYSLQTNVPVRFPDYTPISLNGPTTASIGESIQLNVEIQNIGDGAGNGNGGREAYWLADQPDFSGSIAEYLGASPTPSLAPNEKVQQNPSFTIPSGITPGSYYIIHVVDGDRVIDESDEGNNRKSHQIEITNPRPSLDCANPTPLQHLVKYQGNFTSATNNVTDYGRGGNFTGREVLFRIDLPDALWFQGNVYFDLKGDAEKLILLNSCDPLEVFAGPYVDKGIANVISGVSPGTYYIVVEGPSNGSDGNFELTVRRDHLACTDAKPITIGQPTGPGVSAYDYVNHYCGDPNTTALKGNEAIFELANWAGGDFKATLSDMTRGLSGAAWNDAALILLTDCEDPATCVVSPVVNNGASELTLTMPNLPAGDYTIVVDGVSPEPSPDFKLLINNIQVNPPFSGTIGIDPDIITPDDCSTFEGITYTGQGIRNMFDRRTGVFADYNAYLFDATFSDGLSAEIQVNLEFGSPENARIEAEKYGLAIGQLPTALRNDVQTVWIHKGNEPFGGGNNNILIHTEKAAEYISQGILEETLVHEACHTSLDAAHANTPAWLAAQTSDGNFISTYAKDNPLREDIAESFVPYLALRYRSDRIDASLKQTIEQTIPARIAYLDNLNLNMFPISNGNNSRPDYLPIDFQGPLTANPNQSIEMVFKIRNQGDAPGTGNGGKDKFYINTANNLTLGTPIELIPSTQAFTANIAAGQTFDVTGTVTIPANTASGTYYILFHHDADNQVSECNESNNIVGHQIEVRAGSPDYIPLNFRLDGQTSLTVSRGQRISGSLLAQNQGNSAGISYTEGKYYYSTDANFDAASDLYLGESNDIEPLAAGTGTPESESIKVPSNASLGTGYIFYWLDSEQRIPESNENNNVVFVQLNVTEAPTGLKADFTASSTTPCAGTAITFSSTSTGSNIVLDQSPNEHDGTLINANNPSVNGPSGLGKALDLTTPNDYVTIGNLGDITNWTIETWFKPNRINIYENLFHTTQAATNNGVRVEMVPSNSSIRGDVYVLVSNSNSSITYPIVTRGGNLSNEWHHLAIVGDKTNNKLYVYLDGTKVVDANHTDWPTAFPKFVLGTGYNIAPERNFNGSMDEFRVWNDIRTETEVITNKDRELIGNEDGLLTYYNFNQGLSGGNTAYTWSFPGGTPSSSTEPKPTVTYANPGSYNISLTINSGGQTSSEAKNNYLIVNDCENSINVDFTADKTDICGGQSVQFTSNISAGNSNQVDDLSGKGNHGELTNFEETPYMNRAGYGKALTFDGTNDYVALPQNLTANLNSLTFEAWYFYEEKRIWQRIMDFGSGTGTFMMLTPSGHTGAPQFEIRGPSERLISPDELTTGNWYHFAVVLDGSNKTAKLYIDGQLKAERSITSLPSDLGNLNQNWLGRSQFPDPYLKGQLDEVRIWSTSRTQAQIQANKDQALSGNEAGLLVYYDFNQSAFNNLNYLWEFNGPNLSSSNEVNPAVTFSAPGIYNVSLTVSNGSRSKTETKNGYITVQGCEPDWPVTTAPDYHITIIPSNADITLEGSNIAVGDYIGAFYDDNGTLKCAGKAEWTGQNISITIYGDDATTTNKDGFGIGESFQWKLWKASTDQELYGTATYQAPAGIVTHTGQFAINGVSQISRLTGTTQPPQPVSQTLTLEPGWNYISSYIKASQPDMATIFSSLQSEIVIVKNGDGDVYLPSASVNNIGNWNVVEGYQVKLNSSTSRQLTISGQKADLISTPISFDQGYNLFAYLRESEQAVQVAMAPVVSDIIVVTDEKGRAYIPDLNINNIGNMKPGKGYWAKMKNATNLNYNARLATPPANMHMAMITPNRYSISRKGSHHATMIIDTKDLVDFGDEIGVFDTKGNLVGAATYEDHILAFPVWGDDPSTDVIDGLEENAAFEIRVWKQASGTERVYAFNANMEAYTHQSVIEVKLLRTTETNTLLEANSLQLYPNPTRNVAKLSLTLKAQATVKATLFDLAGKRMLDITQETRPAGSHEWQISTTSLPSGLYHCRILIEGVIHNIPFSVVK